MTTEEAAAFLRLKRRSLEGWRLTGSGPRFFRIGRRRFYKEEDLLAWAEGRTATSTQALPPSPQVKELADLIRRIEALTSPHLEASARDSLKKIRALALAAIAKGPK